MSDEALDAEGLQTDLVEGQVTDNEQVELQDEQKIENPEITQTPAEEKARLTGWRPLDEFEGDPKEWRSADSFNARGEFIGKLKDQDRVIGKQSRRMDEMESEFEKRLDNVNKLHKSELVRKRDDAIDDADRKTANRYQDEIDDLGKPAPKPVASNDQDALDQWNQKNTWIFGDDPKAAYGVSKFNTYRSNGMSIEQSISAMETDVKRSFPDINTNRDNHPTTEGGTKPGRKASGKSLTMADLTGEEMKQYRAFPAGTWEEKEFLQVVKDTRAGK